MQLAASLSTSVWEMLRNAGAAQAAERGQVHVISVAAIRDAVGARWTRHQDLVEDFVLRAFKRAARDDDFIVRVNDADFILIQPGRPAVGALSRASQLMRETLSYFLGAVKAEDVRIAIVDRLQGDGVEATAVSADQLERAAADRPRDLSDSLDGSAPWERFGVASPVRKTLLIERPNAANLRVLFYLEPVWNLRQGAVAAFRIRSVVLQEAVDGEVLPIEPEDLTPRCQQELALRRIGFAAEVWDNASGPPPALHLPVAFHGLTHSSARTAFIARLAALKEAGRQRLMILELTDVPAGLPAVILSGLITQVKPFCRGLLAHAEDLGDIGRWRDTGLCGVVRSLSGENPPTLDHLKRFAATARDVGMAAAYYDVGTHSQFMQAWAAGYSHLSGELISRNFGEPAVPQRFAARDLYASG
ncbi:hypothetical protein [Brevundimonas sp. NIBR11]|uniref:hypothetical protein n=1 Tax=Brevundimonas sp. NIBR11 TaxID=3015999 RepID=UPI0022F128E2|nr:hypothetical protein [Brevundimonas sp. NIBR11]WGM30708.1 hypothetical protein KKHFBJBL_00938 [Brevundimonas sp. NIBR11]